MRSTFWRVINVLVLLLIFALGFQSRPALGQSDATPTLVAEGTISYEPGTGAVRVDPDLTITGSAGAMLDAATVSIGPGFVASQDTLGISGQEGIAGSVEDLAWGYNVANGMLTITGEATLASYQTALRQVTFSNATPGPILIDRLVSISLGSPNYFSENGHFYEFVAAPRVSWTDAKLAAEAMTYADMSGYLVTVTSAEENDFVSDTLRINGWMGASDADHDKEWYWETGPEAGTHFFTQASDEDGCGQGRAETQPAGDHYENWDTPAAPEPNDWPSGCTDSENYGHIFDTGRWNDWPNDSAGQVFGYVVEYGGIEGEPTNAPVGTILIQADEPSIIIENSWVGDDPDLAVSFTVIPEVDDCTEEQTISLPAGDASIDVSVAAEVDETPCTYTVAVTTPVGYSTSPDEVTGLAVDDKAEFTNTATPTDALPRTGSANRAVVILGFVLAGSGWFLVAGGRRREVHDNIDDVEPIDLLPDHGWSEHAVTPATVDHGRDTSAFIDAVAAAETQLAKSSAAVAPSPFTDVTGSTDPIDPAAPAPGPVSNEIGCTDAVAPADTQPTPSVVTSVTESSDPGTAPNTPIPDTAIPNTALTGSESQAEPGGAHAILEDLMQLLDDLAED